MTPAWRRNDSGGSTPTQGTVTAVAGWRPAKPLGPRRERTTERSGVVRASGNEVFALRDKTGARQCLVAVIGTGCEERGASVQRRRRLQRGRSRPFQQTPVSDGRGPSAPVGGFWPPPKDDQAHGEDGNSRNGAPPDSLRVFPFLGRGSETRCSCCRGLPALSPCAGGQRCHAGVGRHIRAKKSGGDQAVAVMGPVGPMERSSQAGAGVVR